MVWEVPDLEVTHKRVSVMQDLFPILFMSLSEKWQAETILKLDIFQCQRLMGKEITNWILLFQL